MEDVSGKLFRERRGAAMWPFCQSFWHTALLGSQLQRYEIPHQFLFSARACYNDKNTKEIAIDSNTMGENQHSDVIFATKLICGADNFHAPCLFTDNFTWQKIHVSRNLFLTRYGENKKWELFLVIDDERIKDQLRSGQAHAHDYGELIRSGEGELLSTEDKTWINTNYPGHTCF